MIDVIEECANAYDLATGSQGGYYATAEGIRAALLRFLALGSPALDGDEQFARRMGWLDGDERELPF